MLSMDVAAGSMASQDFSMASSVPSVDSANELFPGTESGLDVETRTENDGRARVPVPQPVLTFLRDSLTGPHCCCCSLWLRTRLWSAFATLHGLGVGWVVWVYCTSMNDSQWEGVGWLGLAAWSMIGSSMYSANLTLAHAVVDMLGELPLTGSGGLAELDAPLAEPDGPTAADGSSPQVSSFRFVSKLLRTEVSPAAAAELNRGVRVARVQLALYLAIVIILYGGLFIGFRSNDGGYELEQLLCVLGSFCSPLTAHLAAGWLLFINVPCQIATDRIRAHASQVRARKLEGDAILGALHEAHENTVRIAGVLQPTLAMIAVVTFLMAINLAANGIVPRENIDADSVGADVIRLLPPPFLMFGATMMIVASLFPLLKPAEMTDACDELRDAIGQFDT